MRSLIIILALLFTSIISNDSIATSVQASIAASDIASNVPSVESVATTAVVVPVVTLDAGNTAWMMMATILVLLMTIPGLALFYGGMVRKKNILATLMQSFAICCSITLVWIVIGYSLAFSPGNAFIGGFDK